MYTVLCKPTSYHLWCVYRFKHEDDARAFAKMCRRSRLAILTDW